MLVIHLVQDLITPPVLSSLADSWHLLFWHPIDSSLLAEQFNTDVFANTRGWFQNFIQSGQAWAFAIGLILGYVFRSLTTYG
ncbi:MAG: hypothetical protein HC881_05730 [Leptolyngbyaceae cyanobacterium SL_7_1]|nr:hypothetical protein [Leptolyngbyaceae cyanobacterium SL_7_1]